MDMESQASSVSLSLHVCGQLVEDVSNMRESDRSSNIQLTHKEAKARINADTLDRIGIRGKLDVCINPMTPELHPATIINVVN